jgi:hypothetical protein
MYSFDSGQRQVALVNTAINIEGYSLLEHDTPESGRYAVLMPTPVKISVL